MDSFKSNPSNRLRVVRAWADVYSVMRTNNGLKERIRVLRRPLFAETLRTEKDTYTFTACAKEYASRIIKMPPDHRLRVTLAVQGRDPVNFRTAWQNLEVSGLNEIVNLRNNEAWDDVKMYLAQERTANFLASEIKKAFKVDGFQNWDMVKEALKLGFTVYATGDVSLDFSDKQDDESQAGLHYRIENKDAFGKVVSQRTLQIYQDWPTHHLYLGDRKEG